MTVNRLCASSMEAVAVAARAIGMGEMSLAIAGGVESMSRSPWVMPKPSAAFPRDPQVYDTTLGWRFVNPIMEQKYGTISMAETAENVAEKYNVDRASQDRFALGLPAKGRESQGRGSVRGRDRAGGDPRKKGRARDGMRRRTSSRRHYARGPGQTAHAFSQGRDGDGGQRVGNQ